MADIPLAKNLSGQSDEKKYSGTAAVLFFGALIVACDRTEFDLNNPLELSDESLSPGCSRI